MSINVRFGGISIVKPGVYTGDFATSPGKSYYPIANSLPNGGTFWGDKSYYAYCAMFDLLWKMSILD